jgi:DNA-binding beta-propeller fold protein YncE
MVKVPDGRAVLATICGLCLLTGVAVAAPPGPLRLVQTIALPGVEGRIDHMALDADGQRLFVAALGNNTVEVLDLRAGRRVRSLREFHAPQGVGFVASPPRLFVANGGDGSVTVLEADSFRVVKTMPLEEDADNVRVDASGHRVYVGYGSGGLATLDAATGELIKGAELPGHPESFQLEADGPRVFVNVPKSREVCVVDRAQEELIAHWRMDDSQANFAMALDPAGKRVFIGRRRPAQVVVLDAAVGSRLGAVPIDGDVDDLFFDAATRRLFASCGAGYIDVIAAPAAGTLRVLNRIRTAVEARTSLFDPAGRRLFLAVPHRGTQAAEVRVFEVAR